MFTFTTSLVLILATVTASTPNTALTPGIQNSSIVETASNMMLTADQSVFDEASLATAKSEKKAPSVEKYVRAYFAKTPILAEIAYCESRFTHYTYTGTVVRGKIVHEDVGVMQINEDYHLKTAEKLGYNIHSLQGNLAYAQYLYERQGVQPWSASAPCWNR
ncbi:hypothetical protein KW782_00095 [Candidatus Parcubacteria bacterium]|nr:hypothetical protein [Candidatus Parcubacteria bacterium]